MKLKFRIAQCEKVDGAWGVPAFRIKAVLADGETGVLNSERNHVVKDVRFEFLVQCLDGRTYSYGDEFEVEILPTV